MKILVLNGPPRCGKDTLGRIICEGSPSATGTPMAGIPLLQRKKFAAPLRRAMRDLFAWDIAKLEHQKDEPVIHGRTPRDVMIALSEDFFKPTFGTRYFGEEMVRALKTFAERETYGDVFGVVITDGGFLDELDPVVEAFPGDVRVLRMKRTGCTFTGDSRNYITIQRPGCELADLNNDGTIEELRAAAQPHRQWLLGTWG